MVASVDRPQRCESSKLLTILNSRHCTDFHLYWSGRLPHLTVDLDKICKRLDELGFKGLASKIKQGLVATHGGGITPSKHVRDRLVDGSLTDSVDYLLKQSDRDIVGRLKACALFKMGGPEREQPKRIDRFPK